MDILLDCLDHGRFDMTKEEVLTPRILNMLPTFQRFFNMPLTDPFIQLSREEYKDLLGLITALEEENKRLFDYAQRVYSAVNSDYTPVSEGEDDAKSEPD